MNTDVIYSDSLVEIISDAILFRDYYFPFGPKRIRFADLSRVTGGQPTLANGKYRMHGTGDLQTWFPRDWKRPWRGRIFFLHLSHSAKRIGFTVEDSDQAERIFRSNGLWAEASGRTAQG